MKKIPKKIEKCLCGEPVMVGEYTFFLFIDNEDKESLWMENEKGEGITLNKENLDENPT